MRLRSVANGSFGAIGVGALEEFGVNPSIKVDRAAFIVQKVWVRESLLGLRAGLIVWAVLLCQGGQSQQACAGNAIKK